MLNDRYEIVKKIGEGTYGIVYKAIDLKPKPKKTNQAPSTQPTETITKKMEDIKISTDGFQIPGNVEDKKSEKKLFVAIKKLKPSEVFF